MKLKNITEGKKGKGTRKQPIPKDVWKKTPEAGRRGGEHFNPKTDFKRAKEKQKVRKEMNEDDNTEEHKRVYQDVRQEVRNELNHLNFILAKHFDRGPRYENPGPDTIQRLSMSADILRKASHMLAKGTADDKPDPMDE
ncbi:hypothetical protein E4H12_01795 [Candidatus Thorarchaeota archaeon]|nr:MAG: hypothetical protein E4H12_01795 [Candidatus Thorarchaeota archaeon]